METINIEDFSQDGIIKEKEFRKKIEKYDWSKYSNNKVIIKGCSNAPIPLWAYLIITAQLTKHNSKIYYGEKCSAIKIYT